MGVKSIVEGEVTTLQPDVFAVRKALNVDDCLNLNPFIRGLRQDKLVEIFNNMAQGVVEAAQNLSAQTGVEMYRSDGGEFGQLQSLNALTYGAPIDHADVELSRCFMSVVRKPFFALRELEKIELQTGTCPKEKAQEAMDGLKDMNDFVKGVPLFYNCLNGVVPTRAVA